MEKYSQKYFSPTLKQLFPFFEGKNSKTTKNLKEYLRLLTLFMRVHENYSRSVIYEAETKPITSTEDILDTLETMVSEVLTLVNTITEECRTRYELSPHQKRIVLYVQKKAEELWVYVNRLLADVSDGNEYLLYIEDNDYVAEEIPYKKDFSNILKLPMSFN